MRLRILDKYLLREFAWPLMYSFDAFLLLFIVHDLLENLGDFLRQRAEIGMILRYYLVMLPEPLVFILPLTVLLGVLFCLSMLGRHNELLAMRTSGISVWRLGLPFFVVGLMASAVSFGLGDKFAPQSRERALALQRQMSGLPAKEKLRNFFFSNQQEYRDWYAREFAPEENVMDNVAFYLRDRDGKPLMDVFARRAVWTAERWQFEDVRIVHPPAPDAFVATTNFPFITETPKRLLLESKHHQEMTTTELRRFARALRNAGRASQQPRYLVEMHGRYAMPLTCLVVVVLGVPLGMQVSRRGPMMGVGMALVLVVTFFIVMRLSLQFGYSGRLPPVVAAWLPNVIFGAVGAALFWRAR
ncbi:MAG: YjgP/YjgQ family permease [Verrucomicrobia bacterium]|nr:YjgP/YjgQ family permease [Verrucomicrobiota bacterium]